ncbi:hypothetical protein PQR05_10240 [Paraburkholderia sediminicola]|uniref:hypothetical protein n=1 Tax=Paraburkholderia sediminicola TaxID=458836 RepID=UPI0038B6B9ED
MAATTSKYHVNVTPGIERAEAISAALQSPDYMAKFFHFKGSEHNLKVVTLSIDLLLYRLSNARTRDDQLSLVEQNRYPANYFDIARQEDVDVQQAQHDILFGFSQVGLGDSVVPIYGELEKKKKQTEPILVTDHGVIVNGNRRVSAMRELLQQPGAGSFNHVSCMVLPPSATEADLIEIEFKLQMAPETRLPYTWTNEARSCKQLRDANRSVEYIAEMKDDDPKRVSNLIQMYEMAERYLNEWLQRPGAFNLLDNTRQAFFQMVTRRQQKRPMQQKEVAQAFDFFVVEHRQALEDRAYDFINAIESDPGKFAEKYAENVGITLSVAPPSIPDEADQLLIDLGADDQEQEKDILPLISHLKEIRGNKEQSEAALQTVEAVSELLIAQKKDSGGAALKLSRDAFKKLSSVDPSTAAKKTVQELVATLERIEEKTKTLLEQARRHSHG